MPGEGHGRLSPARSSLPLHSFPLKTGLYGPTLSKIDIFFAGEFLFFFLVLLFLFLPIRILFTPAVLFSPVR